ncbi:MAG TPA: cupin domain-containing protein [Solirubrobacteraceae bacterium]|nr:cupin domain-containing protein [Solirubrobacteraceae bacterium]
MPATPVRAGHTRRIETPNATMTTLASPTLGSSGGLSLWTVEMEAGARGPLHVFDSEQLWTVLAGELSIAVGEDSLALFAGDTIVLPAGAERQVTATTAARIVVCGHGGGRVTVAGEAASRGTPAWIA